VSLSRGDVYLSCPGAVELGVLLPHLAGVIVEEVAVAAGLAMILLARARAPEAACTRCGTVSGRVHSRYSRRLADAAVGGCRVEIVLAVRRFFCLADCCKRRTFAEQVEGLTVRYARKTPLLAGMLGSVAVARAGRGDRGWPPAWASRHPARSCCGWSWPSRTRKRRYRGCSGSTYPGSAADRPERQPASFEELFPHVSVSLSEVPH
jgi:hypothetical protein